MQERRIALHCDSRAVHGYLQLVRERGVGERVRAGVRNGTGHVADAVVNDAVKVVDGVVVGGLVDGLDAAALIDGHVDDDGSRPHVADHLLADDDRRPSASDEHSADHEIGIGQVALDRATVRRERDDPPLLDLVHPAQPIEVLVEQHDLGLHPGRDPRRVPSDVAGAENNDLGRTDAGSTSHQDAASTVVTFEEVGAHLRREPAGDLAHRRKQGERAVLSLHGLVGDAGRAGREQRLGNLWIGGQVEVCEEGQIGAQESELLGLWLLDLDDHTLGPRVGGRRHNGRPGCGVVPVGDAGPLPGMGLDEDVDAVTFEFAYAVGGHRNPMLCCLYFFRDTNGEECCHGQIVHRDVNVVLRENTG